MSVHISSESLLQGAFFAAEQAGNLYHDAVKLFADIAVLLDRERIDGYARRAKRWLLANFSQTSYDDSLRKMLEDPNFVIFYHAPAPVLASVCVHSQ